jgi:hypothetical protein
MPRAKVIGWTLIACGLSAGLTLPYVVKPHDRFISASLEFYPMMTLALGYCFIALPVLYQLIIVGGERTEAQLTHERRSCAGIVCLAILLLAAMVYFMLQISP